jgi:uncharacterized RDD family membrane protein YckC
MRYWYYLQGDKQFGPVSDQELAGLFQSGKLSPSTLVWTQELREWARACDVQNLVPPEFNPPPPPVPPPAPVITQKADKPVQQIRPWVRYCARMLDTWGTTLIVGFIVGIVYPRAAEWNEILFGMALLLAYCFIEPMFFDVFGTTPGKALLGIDVRTQSGERLSYSQAWGRTLSIWWRGLGMGLPLVSLITLSCAYYNLTRKKITTWDRHGAFQVSHRKIGLFKGIVATLLLLGLLTVFGIMSSIGKNQ